MFHHLRMASAALLSLTLAATASALNLQIDYTHDTTSFYTNFPAAMLALEAAAADIESAITTTLNATTDTNAATMGGFTVTFDFRYNYTNPTTGAAAQQLNAALGADVMTIYAGVRNLAGTTLGEGGPGALGANLSGSGNPVGLPAAMNAAEAAANANMQRGGGPIFGTLSGNLGGEPWSVEYGSTIGNIWFDTDSNNNGATDTAAMLNAYWHFDHTTSVAAGKHDFYSVALHELLHALGIASAQTWDDLVSLTDPNDWLGPSVIALLGSGNEVLENDSNHILNGTMSTRISDNMAQEAAMDPSLTIGTRKSLTWLDLAFLDDIGWDVISMSQIGDTDGDGDVDFDDFLAVQNFFGDAGPNSPGDADGDGDCDFDDFLAVNNFFGVMPPGVSFVPEPTSFLLFGAFCAPFLSRRRPRIS